MILILCSQCGIPASRRAVTFDATGLPFCAACWDEFYAGDNFFLDCLTPDAARQTLAEGYPRLLSALSDLVQAGAPKPEILDYIRRLRVIREGLYGPWIEALVARALEVP